MKRKWMWLVAGALAIAAVITVRVEARGWNGWHGRAGMLHAGWWSARELQLTTGQRQQVVAIWQRERPAVAALVHELAGENAELAGATEENRKEITRRQAQTLGKLLLEKEKVRTEVFASVLDGQQRVKAAAIEQRWNQRLERVAERLGEGGHHAQ